MAAITGAVIAVGTAGYTIYNAETKKKEANKAIEEFGRQDIVNPFKNIQISTEKSDQQTEAGLSSFATSTEALQRAGTRGILGGIPRLSESNILLQNIISSDLDEKAKARDMAIAQAEERNQLLRENRESLALQGLGQQLQTARQDSATGMVNLASGVLALGSAINNQGVSVENEANPSPKMPNTNEVFNTNGTVIGNNLVETPVAQVQPFLNPNSPFFYERKASAPTTSIFPQNYNYNY